MQIVLCQLFSENIRWEEQSISTWLGLLRIIVLFSFSLFFALKIITIVLAFFSHRGSDHHDITWLSIKVTIKTQKFKNILFTKLQQQVKRPFEQIFIGLSLRIAKRTYQVEQLMHRTALLSLVRGIRLFCPKRCLFWFVVRETTVNLAFCLFSITTSWDGLNKSFMLLFAIYRIDHSPQ